MHPRPPAGTDTRASFGSRGYAPELGHRSGTVVARVLCALAVALALARPGAALAERPSPAVASINVCADQLVLSLADAAQILSVSWLAADPEESLHSERAARFPLNYGTAEELLHYAPDVVIAGALTNEHTRRLLVRLGYEVVALAPAASLADIESNIARVAAAVGHPERGAAQIRAMRERAGALRAARPEPAVAGILIRPGGFTVGSGSLAHELMRLAGVLNIAAEQGLDRWGSLAMETLLESEPELIVLTGYQRDAPSLANAVLGHPAVAAVTARVPSATVPAPYWSCGLPESLEVAASLQRAIRAAETPRRAAR